MHEHQISDIVNILRQCNRLLFITGAGISADSGLPTYRGVAGLYNDENTVEGFPIEQVLSGTMFQLRPELTWKYLMQVGRAARQAEFNRGHAVIAEMDDRFDHVCVLTQNIDGFHCQAGSHNVIEIHGSMHRIRCTRCDATMSTDQFEHDYDIDFAVGPPRCQQCEAFLRPDVVLFEEMLPVTQLHRLQSEIDQGFDAVFTIGTSSLFPYIVEPVVAAARQSIPTVEINPQSTTVTEVVDVALEMRAANALDLIWKRFQGALAK